MNAALPEMKSPAAVVAPVMKVEIWSDVVCPWCYIGKRRFEAALARFDHRDDVEVVWRSFELDPGAPAVREGSYAGRLAAKYGVPVTEAQAMIDRMTGAAAGTGLAFRFDIARPGNTFDAHRLLHLALDRGVQDAAKERLLAAAFTEGLPIGDRDTLVHLGADAGLDATEVRAVLEGDTYGAEVRRDEREAAELGIHGVPFFVVDRRYAVSGAQAPEVLLAMLDQAWSDAAGSNLGAATGAGGGGQAAACDDGSCAVPVATTPAS
jgi:predicted DsbA family dithiol-disulfide isomerase